MRDIKKILENILTPFWFKKLYPVIIENNNKDYFFFDNNKFFPNLEDRFNAINNINTSDNNTKIVVFGQDPYPRKESARGYAFWDGKIKSWENPLSPSFRNIIKSILINENLATKENKIKDLRRILKDNKIFSPDDFFKNSIENGVVWLNASLTFESKSQTDLNAHLKFWKPIIEEIINTLLENSKNIIFVFWGSKSLKLQKYIQTLEFSNYHFVSNCHPMLESFHNKNSFKEIDKILINLNEKKIKWLDI